MLHSHPSRRPPLGGTRTIETSSIPKAVYPKVLKTRGFSPTADHSVGVEVPSCQTGVFDERGRNRDYCRLNAEGYWTKGHGLKNSSAATRSASAGAVSQDRQRRRSGSFEWPPHWVHNSKPDFCRHSRTKAFLMKFRKGPTRPPSTRAFATNLPPRPLLGEIDCQFDNCLVLFRSEK